MAEREWNKDSTLDTVIPVHVLVSVKVVSELLNVIQKAAITVQHERWKFQIVSVQVSHHKTSVRLR